MAIYFLTLAILGAIFITIVLGFNIQYGLTGILNFSYITFVAAGAYTTAVTTLGRGTISYPQEYILHWSVAWPIALLLSGLVASALSLLLAFAVMQRLRSDYLAIATIALGTVVWTIVGNVTFLFNGWTGLAGIPRPYSNLGLNTNGGLTGDVIFFVICVGVAAVAFLVTRRLYRSPLGRVLRVVREDPDVAATFGRNVVSVRLFAFVVGSFIAGVGGGLLVMEVGAFNPNAFVPAETFLLLAAVIVGGSSSPWGSAVGAVLVMVLIDEATRYLPTQQFAPSVIGGLRTVVTGALLVAVLRFLPNGIVPENNSRFYRGRWRKARLRSGGDDSADEATGEAI